MHTRCIASSFVGDEFIVFQLLLTFIFTCFQAPGKRGCSSHPRNIPLLRKGNNIDVRMGVIYPFFAMGPRLLVQNGRQNVEVKIIIKTKKVNKFSFRTCANCAT